MNILELKSFIQSSRIAGYMNDFAVNSDGIIIEAEIKFLESIVCFLRDDCKFEVLVDIFGVDYLDREKRFNIIYNFLSMYHNIRMYIKIYVDASTSVPSMTSFYNSACWYEREVYDMYGVKFADNHNMNRILSDYNFEGHPMRKDFPLSGYYEVRYDLEKKKVVYDSVQLEQEFRNFDFLSPWEGIKYPDESKN